MQKIYTENKLHVIQMKSVIAKNATLTFYLLLYVESFIHIVYMVND